jgi:hypothetical protein
MNEDKGLVWVNDKEGREFVCALNGDCNDSLRGRDQEIPRKLEELSECEQVSCRVVNKFGIEWW